MLLVFSVLEKRSMWKHEMLKMTSKFIGWTNMFYILKHLNILLSLYISILVQ